MELVPDTIVYWQWGFVKLNATILFTWIGMAILVVGAWLTTRRLTTGPAVAPGQNVLEAVVVMIQREIEQQVHRSAAAFLPFIGTLFLFIVTLNLMSAVPGVRSPTSSLSTTAALAFCVFLAVPFFGVTELGVRDYLRQYTQPSVFMLPFNLIGELSRTIALAVRLFGNMMSGEMIIAILLLVAPLFFPVIMQVLGLLVGVIQAYIFAVLTTVFIASAISRPPQTS